MKKLGQCKIIEKKILGLLIISGLSFSGISFYSFFDKEANFNSGIFAISTFGLCEIGECFSAAGQNESEPTFVSQNVVTKSGQLKTPHIENFDNLRLPTEKTPEKEYQLSGNKATLFPEKDSFVREGVKTTNEGASKILRVMGMENTNNRVLIAFNQEDIKTVATGKKLESATLKLHVESNDKNWGDGMLIDIYPLESEWVEGSSTYIPFSNLASTDSGVTWNCPTGLDNCQLKWNGGVYSSSPTDSVFITNQILKDYWIKFDVTKDVQDHLTGKNHYGWIIMKSEEDEGGRINFASREAQLNIPELVLVFAK